MHKSLTIAIATALILGTGLAIAKENEKDREKDDRREYREAAMEKRGEKWLLRNDNISIWFHETPSGKAKPMLKVFATDEDGNKSGFKFRIDRLCEVDANATSCKGAYATMKLAYAQNWNTDVVRDEGNGTITIHMLVTHAQGVVGIVFYLSDNATTVKFDVNVDNWRWKEATGIGLPAVTTHRLLLEMKVDERHGDDLSDDDEDGNVTVRDGFVTWAPNATATYAGGLQKTLNVTAFTKVSDEDDEDEDDDSERSHGRIALRFDGDGGYRSLAYDPTLGVASASSGVTVQSLVPSVGAVAAVATVAAVGLIAARRSFR